MAYYTVKNIETGETKEVGAGRADIAVYLAHRDELHPNRKVDGRYKEEFKGEVKGEYLKVGNWEVRLKYTLE